MLFSRPWFALMRRNLIYRQRNFVGTILEVILPVGFVAILWVIKNAVANNGGLEPEIIEATFPGNQNAFKPLTFRDYVSAMTVERKCVKSALADIDFDDFVLEFINVYDYAISGMESNDGSTWPVPMMKCDPLGCEEDQDVDVVKLCDYAILAVAGSDAAGQERAEKFKEYVDGTYPGLVDVPVDFDMVQVFDSDAALSDYVQSDDYGKTGFPKVAMGVVWDEGNDEKNYKYRLRQNSTNFNNPIAEARPAVRSTPMTKILTEAYAKADDVCFFTTSEGGPTQGELQDSCTGQYMYNGVLTFQRLVGDFILEDTNSAASGYKVSEAGVSFVPFPTPEYEQQGFYSAIAATLQRKKSYDRRS